MNWSDALSFAEKGFNAWAAKDHNRKWVRKIDGTPIKNDLLVNIATAIAEAHVTAQAQPAPIAGLEPVAWQLRYAGSNHPWVNAEKVNTGSDIEWRGLVPVAQAEAHAAEQVRAERERIAAWHDERESIARLLTAAKLLQQNAVGCATNHHGHDCELNGLPGWLADTKKDIDAAEDAILAMQAERRGATRPTIPTCCVTGAIPGDGGACGDCDPCILGEGSVPEAVKRLIAEKNGLIQRVGELEDRLEVSAHPAPIAVLEPVAWRLRYSDSNDPWVIAEKVNTTSLIEWRGLVPVEQAQAHAAEQVRAEREAIAEQLQGWADFIDTEAAQSMSVASAAYANGGSLADDLRSAILAMQAERRGVKS